MNGPTLQGDIVLERPISRQNHCQKRRHVDNDDEMEVDIQYDSAFRWSGPVVLCTAAIFYELLIHSQQRLSHNIIQNVVGYVDNNLIEALWAVLQAKSMRSRRHLVQ